MRDGKWADMLKAEGYVEIGGRETMFSRSIIDRAQKQEILRYGREEMEADRSKHRH